MRKHYKNITEAMKVERPSDKVVKVLSNKFAIVKPAIVGGGFADERIMGIGKGTDVYTFGLTVNMKSWCSHVEANFPNIQKETICYDFPANGKRNVWLVKNCDNRKFKQNYRKIAKLI